tara:strand:+ start:517 stop:2730 length:2214 start_codon:yes stop_codon:yes gene_type:complete
MAKMTYAQIAEKLNNQYNKYDKNLQNAVTDAEKNSAMMMLQRVAERMNQLMLANQAEANAADQNETPPDSPNQSIGQRTMRMAENGGSLKSIPKGNKGLPKLSKKIRNKMGYMGKGGSVSWNWGGKKYSGTLIPSKETSTHRYARTHNGKIKSLPKKQNGGKLPKLSIDQLNALSYEQRMPYYKLPPTDARSFGFNTSGWLPSQAEFDKMPMDIRANYYANNPQMNYKFSATDAPNFQSMKPQDQMRQKIAGLNPNMFMQAGGPVANPYNRPFLPLEKERMEFLGNLPSQSVDFQLFNFDKNSGVNRVLANRLFEADSLSRLPFQHSNFELSNFRPSQENFNQMSQAEREGFAAQYPGFYQIEGVPTKAELDAITSKMKMQKGGRLYDNVTMEQIKEYLEEAGVLSGLGDKFDPKNPEHVKKLQEGLLGAYTGPGADRMLSGTELEFIGPDGPQSINQAGVDGKFGIDTFTALQQFSEAKNPFSNLKPLELQPLELPELKADLSELKPIDPVDRVESGGGGDEDPSVKKYIANQATNLLPGAAKYLEYAKTYNTLNSMLPPPDLTLMRPRYINTKVDISPELAALNDAQLMRERSLVDSSTKSNNVLQNLNASGAKFNRLRNELYGKKRNEERNLQNMQSMLGFQADDENRKRIYDNTMNQRDFINDQSLARRDFMSGVVGDVMDLQTQKTDRASQMARLNALMPYLNQFGVYDRAYDPEFLAKYPFMAELLGLKST